jgi:hypothetical protein
VTEPYNHDDDDDQPTLQRVSPTSSKIAAALPVLDAFPDESTTATDLDVLGSAEGDLVAMDPIAEARDFDDIDTQKMPVEVRAGLVRASQVDDGA